MREFFTVSQVTAAIKALIEDGVGSTCIKGELSGIRPSAAGHLYFSLKDDAAVLSCAMFRSAGSRVKFELKDGLEVLAYGRVSVYPPRGNYQLIVDRIEPVGHGALTLAFEKLKAKLMKEGLFEPSRKRPIPPHPSKVAIITSPTGAALQDMLNVLGRRNAGISILVVPSLVQGEAAAEQLVAGIEVVNRFDAADVIVVSRGGGSLEDLWCFNDERVVRAVAESRIPVISAVGHEIDFTLCDFAADLRAPTPSAAAELVSRSRLDLIEALTSQRQRLAAAMSVRLGGVRTELLSLEKHLISPAKRIALWRSQVVSLDTRMRRQVESRIPVYRQLIDELSSNMIHASQLAAADRRRKLEILSGRLEALSPLKVLGRGYTLTQDSTSGRLIKSAHEANSGLEVDLRFHDGKAKARIL